jgi:hypothetical protein
MRPFRDRPTDQLGGVLLTTEEEEKKKRLPFLFMDTFHGRAVLIE